jgi:hypothetical protein
MGWFTTEIADLFIQAIIGIAALVALQQISVAKKSITTNSRRDSIKYASDLIKICSEKLIPLIQAERTLYITAGYKNIKGDFELKKFEKSEIENGSSRIKEDYNLGVKILAGNKDDINYKTLEIANLMEAIATPLVEGVADESIAFKVVGNIFCRRIRERYFFYCVYRATSPNANTSYTNTLSLYHMWSDRIKKLNLQDAAQSAQDALNKITDKQIKPIGTE